MRTFEIEDRTEYYGSYTDRIITGSMLPDGKRGKVGSVVSGSDEWKGETRFSAWYLKYQNPFFRSGMTNCIFATAQNTFFNCSIPPDFREITLINGGKFVAPKWDEIVVNASTQPFDQPIIKIFLSSAGTITGSDSSTITDNIWWYAYPFASGYANVKKLPYISKVSVAASHEEYASDGRLYYRTVTEPTSSNRFVICTSIGNNAAGPIIWLNSYDTIGTVDVPNETFDSTQTTGLSDRDFTSIYFGYKATACTILTFVYTQGLFGYNFGVKIRGFKYGLMNGTPIQPKMAFNRNHFGFRSDILEQGLHGTTWNEKTGKLSKPISVTFVSGTNSAYSASHPELNTNGSGIYDNECRATKPFTELI